MLGATLEYGSAGMDELEPLGAGVALVEIDGREPLGAAALAGIELF